MNPDWAVEKVEVENIPDIELNGGGCKNREDGHQ